MPTKYIVRVASNVPYEYWQAESDTYGEMLGAEQELRELKVGGDPAQDQAIQNLANGGVRTSLPGLNKPTGLGAAKPAAAPQQGGDDAWKGEELGTLPDGTIITVHATGKFGPFVKARNIPGREKGVFANLPKGAAAEQIDLATAIGLIEQKMAA